MNLFITAAFGSNEILKAAERLESQAKATNIFTRTLIVTESDLKDICPHLFKWYSHEELNASTGFGFFAWKSAVADAAMSGYWGDFSSVTYLDAGCEIVPGPRSRRMLKDLISLAQEKGVVAFNSGCPEWQYTKSFVWKYFENISKFDESDQLMGGVWILSGKIGKKAAVTWNSLVAQSPEMTNNYCKDSPLGFIAPRHDQSIFSLVVKSLNIKPLKVKPPFPRKSLISRVYALRFPIWAARNRTSATTITAPLRIFSYLLFLPGKLR